MKLYLSSYHLGDQSAKLFDLYKNKKVALISNALDYSTDTVRLQKSAQREIDDLQSIGLDPEELDLRTYFGKGPLLEQKISEFGGVWVRGGNTFIIRKAMQYSGLDSILQELRSTEFVYAGYSAGSCVVTPTLKGIHLADKPDEKAVGYDEEVLWDGLGFVKYCIAPHYRSGHAESDLVEKVVEYFEQNNIEYKTLRDGEVILEEIS